MLPSICKTLKNRVLDTPNLRKSVTPKMPSFEFLEDLLYTFAQTNLSRFMKKNYLLVLLLIGIVASFIVDMQATSIACEGVLTKVDMHREVLDSSLIKRVPERDPLELSCYVIDDINTIFLSANKTVLAEIEIENFTTGDYASYYDQISTASLSLPVYGSGRYLILVTLSNGVNYFGEFTL